MLTLSQYIYLLRIARNRVLRNDMHNDEYWQMLDTLCLIRNIVRSMVSPC